jgi:hypothetical protein
LWGVGQVNYAALKKAADAPPIEGANPALEGRLGGGGDAASGDAGDGAAARMRGPPEPNSKAQRDMASVIQRLESMYEVTWDSDEEVRLSTHCVLALRRSLSSPLSLEPLAVRPR